MIARSLHLATLAYRARHDGRLPVAVWYIDGRPERPGDRCRHGRLVCDRCVTPDAVPARAWGTTSV